VALDVETRRWCGGFPAPTWHHFAQYFVAAHTQAKLIHGQLIDGTEDFVERLGWNAYLRFFFGRLLRRRWLG
jgi:hypothetical protein